jgi:hypothetical protein
MQDVTHLPTGMFNLFSLSIMQRRGWLLYGDVKKIWLEKWGNKIMFDLMVPTPKGVVYCMYMNHHSEMATPSTDDDGNVAPIVAPATATTMSIKPAHAKFAHSNEEETLGRWQNNWELLLQEVLWDPATHALLQKRSRRMSPRLANTKAPQRQTKEESSWICRRSRQTSKASHQPSPIGGSWLMRGALSSSATSLKRRMEWLSQLANSSTAGNKTRFESITSAWTMLGRTSCYSRGQRARIGS